MWTSMSPSASISTSPSLLHIHKHRSLSSDLDEKIGSDVVAKAILSPTKAIAANAGVDGGVVEKISSQGWQTGYNTMTGKYEDLLLAGVIDPCKVMRCALQSAVSIAGVILTTQAILVEKTKKPRPSIPVVPVITP